MADITVNGTVTASAGQEETVTGQTAFWAVMALALNAMAQSSTTTDLVFGTKNMFKGGLAPQMSSPIVGLTDFLFESAFLLRIGSSKLLAWRQSRDHNLPNDEITPGPGAGQPAKISQVFGVRLVLFLFAVLPQAIKVFGMLGVPALQVVIALFLAAPLVRIVSTFAGSRIEAQKRAISQLASLTKSEVFEAPTLRRRVYLFAGRNMVPIVRNLLLGSHFLAYGCVWHEVAKRVNLQQTDFAGNIRNLLQWSTFISMILAYALSVFWITEMFFWSKWMRRIWMPQTPPLHFYFLLHIPLMYVELLLEAGGRMNDGLPFPGGLSNTTLSTVPLLCAAFICSFALAITILRLSRSIWKDGDAVSTAQQDSVPANLSSTVSHTSASEDASNVWSQISDKEWPGVSLWKDEDSAWNKMVVCGTLTLTFPIFFLGMDIIGSSKQQREVSTVRACWYFVSGNFFAFRHLVPAAIAESWNAESQHGQHVGVQAETSSDGQLDQHGHVKEESEASQQAEPRSSSQGERRLSNAGNDAAEGNYHAQQQVRRASYRVRLRRLASVLTWATLLFLVQLACFIIYAFFSMTDFNLVGRQIAKRITKHVRNHTGWICFAIFNLLTAAAYYTVAFDGTGTVNPTRTDFLGRRV